MLSTNSRNNYIVDRATFLSKNYLAPLESSRLLVEYIRFNVGHSGVLILMVLARRTYQEMSFVTFLYSDTCCALILLMSFRIPRSWQLTMGQTMPRIGDDP